MAKRIAPSICHFCRKEFGLLEDRYVVRRAHRPKGVSFRWMHLGFACELCADEPENELNIEYKG